MFNLADMDIVPPPMDSEPVQPSSSILEGTEDDDESLFAVVGQQKKVDAPITATNTSGYESADATSTNDAVNILRYTRLFNVQNLLFFYIFKVDPPPRVNKCTYSYDYIINIYLILQLRRYSSCSLKYHGRHSR